MLYGGFATGAIGLLGHFFTALEQDSLIPMHERAFMTVGVSISSIIGGHLLVIANQVNLYFKALLFCFFYFNTFIECASNCHCRCQGYGDRDGVDC